MDTYEVKFHGRAVGKVTCRKEGLYCAVECACKLPQGSMMRLIAASGQESVNLGILIPDGEEFTLMRRITAKSLGQGELRFELEPLYNELLVPISESEPFPLLHRIRDAKLRFKDGEMYLAISENNEIRG